MERIVYLARHGETDWNHAGRYQGQLDESRLTGLGEAQGRALADALVSKPISRVIASPLQRCIDTARPLAQRLELGIDIDERLIEISHGSWEGHLREEIERDEAALYERWRAHPHSVEFPGGESLDDVLGRWDSFAASLQADGDVLIVTHDVLVRLAILDVSGRSLDAFWEPRVVNGGYARFAHDGATWRLLEECCESHLRGMIVDTSRQAL